MAGQLGRTVDAIGRRLPAGRRADPRVDPAAEREQAAIRAARAHLLCYLDDSLAAVVLADHDGQHSTLAWVINGRLDELAERHVTLGESLLPEPGSLLARLPSPAPESEWPVILWTLRDPEQAEQGWEQVRQTVAARRAARK